MAKEGSLFEKFYAAAEDIKKMAKKPIEERRLKRKFEAAYDDAENQKIDAEKELEESRMNISDYDINKIVEKARLMEELDAAQELIKKEYKEMFGEDLKR